MDTTGSVSAFLDPDSVLSIADDIDDDVAAFSLMNEAAAMYNDRCDDKKASRGGSAPGKAENKPRDFEGRYQRMLQQYFVDNSVYNEEDFRRRFRMSKRLFNRIFEAVIQKDQEYFSHRQDAAGKWGIRPLLKVIAALRILAYGVSADFLDENLEMSKTVALESVRHFIDAVDSCFGDEYLRDPTEADLAQLLAVNAQRGFVGMWSSIDCMHWQWKNCPASEAGQFKGKEKKPTVVLEACADQELWIWHASFGWPGSLNDLNILDRSPLFDNLMRGEAPRVSFTLGGADFEMAYALADGIYPEWAVFVKTFANPRGRKQSYFTQRQESCRKDVERAFGVLQARWRILALPSKYHARFDMLRVMRTCIILHNMIVEDSRGVLGFSEPNTHDFLFDSSHTLVPVPEFRVSRPSGVRPRSVAELAFQISAIEDSWQHFKLRDKLIDHLWDLHGDE